MSRRLVAIVVIVVVVVVVVVIVIVGIVSRFAGIGIRRRRRVLSTRVESVSKQSRASSWEKQSARRFDCVSTVFDERKSERIETRRRSAGDGMAKVGEGDARWIVSERSDGTNVHGWHWQEKDALAWSRSRLEKLLVGLCVDDVRTTEVLKCEGEAYVNKRKGKIIPGYEIEVEIGYASGEGSKGKVRFPYVADENADEDPEALVLPSSDGEIDERAKARALKGLVPEMLAAMRVFVKEMAAGGPGGEGPDPKPEAGAAALDDEAVAVAPKAAPKAAEARSDKTAPLSQTNHTIKMTENFYCRPRDICECLMDVVRVQHFTQSRASGLNGSTGNFEMFDGNVHGETIEYDPGEKIVQKWRFRSWPDEHYSVVTITFREPEPGNCFVDLVQTNVPECDKFGNETVMDTTENGWKNLIFGRIRQVFGFGA